MYVRSPRIFFALAALSIAAVCPAQEKPVDFTTVAVPVSKALVGLSKQSGVALEVSGPIGKRILVLRLKGASLKDAMDRIAMVTDGEWQTMEGGYRLVLSQAKLQAARDAEIAMEAEAIRKSIASKTDALVKEPAFDTQIARSMALQLQDVQKRMSPNTYDQATYQQQSRIESRTPAGRALNRVIPMLDPVELAKFPSEGRTVFSNVPTKMERPFPRSVAPVLDAFMKEQQIWADEAQKVFGDQPTTGYRYNDIVSIKEKPAKCLLAVVRYGFGSGLGLELTLADSIGRVVGRGSAQISDQWQDVENLLQKAAAQTTKEEPLTFSPASDRFLKSFQEARSGSRGFPALDDESKKALMNPEQVDPLSFMPSEGLIRIGELRNENVVAGLPDLTFFSTAFVMGAVRPTPTAFLQGLKAVQAEVDEKDGWLTVRPKVSSAMVVNADRAVTGKLVRSVYANGRLPLAEAAAYAASAGGPQEDILTLMLVGLMDSSAIQVLDSNWYCLKVYGMMTPTQRKILESGQPMELRMLTPGQREAVEHMVYGANSRLQPKYQPNPNGQQDTAYELFFNGIYREATESLPNGIPGDGTLALTTSNNEVVFLGEQTNLRAAYLSGSAMTADELARQVYMSEHTDIFPWMAEQKPSFDKLKVGTQVKLDFMFEFNDRVFYQTSLNDSLAVKGQFVSLDKLPDEFKKRYEAAYENVKKSYANAKPGQFTAPPVRSDPPPRLT